MLYTVKLNSFNTDEIIMIDLCMKLLNFDASQAYDCIDNMPSVLAEGIDMNKVKEIRTAFESEGAILDVIPISDEQAYKVNKDKVGKSKESLSTNNKLASTTSSSLNSSDLEILNLKYNPYENTKNNDEILKSNNNTIKTDKLEDRRNGVTYGRRSTDINPMSTNYGRRSTDVNPMMYNDNSNASSYLDNLDTLDTLDNNKTGSVYAGGLNNNKTGSVYTGGLNNNQTGSVYTSNSSSVYTNDQSPYTSGINNSEFTYKSPYLNNEEDKDETQEQEDFGFEIDEPKEKLNDKVNDLKSSSVYNMLNTNTEQLVEENKSVEPPKIPYDNNMMNFTQQQDVGEISKDDNLFSLSGISRDKFNTAKGSLPYEKEQITCPKCGSAFVSTKRAQGIFGTGKVKYVCEACKNKF